MIRLALRVRRADADLVLAEVLELAPAGVEEIELPARDGEEGFVEYAVYGAPGELPELPDLRAAAGGALVEVSTTEIPDDWSERWKRFHKPVLIEPPVADLCNGVDSLIVGEGDDVHTPGPSRARAPSLYVRPPWEAPSERLGVREIVIDPAQAFGTGAHATTRLCLELLSELAAADPARGSVLDVGAGSGVLAIAAARLGYRPILALDNDLESVAAIVDNATANDVDIEARRFDLRSESLPLVDGAGRRLGEPVVLANLLKPLLYELSAAISSPPRHLIVSGLLCAEAAEVASQLAARHSLRERRWLERGEWAALWLSRD